LAKKIVDALEMPSITARRPQIKWYSNKKMLKRWKILKPAPEEKDKVYYFIDMAITHHKTKKAFAHKKKAVTYLPTA